MQFQDPRELRFYHRASTTRLPTTSKPTTVQLPTKITEVVDENYPMPRTQPKSVEIKDNSNLFKNKNVNNKEETIKPSTQDCHLAENRDAKVIVTNIPKNDLFYHDPVAAIPEEIDLLQTYDPSYWEDGKEEEEENSKTVEDKEGKIGNKESNVLASSTTTEDPFFSYFRTDFDHEESEYKKLINSTAKTLEKTSYRRLTDSMQSDGTSLSNPSEDNYHIHYEDSGDKEYYSDDKYDVTANKARKNYFNFQASFGLDDLKKTNPSNNDDDVHNSKDDSSDNVDDESNSKDDSSDNVDDVRNSKDDSSDNVDNISNSKDDSYVSDVRNRKDDSSDNVDDVRNSKDDNSDNVNDIPNSKHNSLENAVSREEDQAMSLRKNPHTDYINDVPHVIPSKFEDENYHQSPSAGLWGHSVLTAPEVSADTQSCLNYLMSTTILQLRHIRCYSFVLK